MQVGALEVVLLVLLLQQVQVPVDLLLLGEIELALHARQGLNLGCLRDLALEFLSLDAFPQHVDLVAVEVLDSVDHQLLLRLFEGLVLHELALLFQKLVLLQI